jgi:alpha-1,2-mannosyltransferase
LYGRDCRGTDVTASGTRISAVAAARPPASPQRVALTAVICTATLLAVGLRLYDLSRPGFLLGINEYDDGTDFGSAIRLVHGALPYRDFVMVQPPGITLLLYPVALATRTMGTDSGMAVARVITSLASAAAVPVAGLLTRHRGLFATLVICGVLAIFPDSILAARTVLLEPWLVLFCLLGAVVLFDGDQVASSSRRLFLGGVLFGFAGAVKVWAILPVMVILVLSARRPRQASVYAAGVTLGFCVPVLPFALTAPTVFYRGVIVAQLVRTDIARIPEGYRLHQMLGLPHFPQLATPALVIIGIVLVLVLAAVTVLGSRLAHSPPPALDRFATGSCALVVVAFLWPVDFYYHYPAFLAPFLALTMALPAARLLAAVPAGETRTRPGSLRHSALTTAAATLVVLTVYQVIHESGEDTSVPTREIAAARRLIPPGACVATDQASFTIAIDRFVSTVPGCSLMIDGLGTDYALADGRNPQIDAGRSPAVEAAWMSAFRAAGYVWLTTLSYRRIPWTPQLKAYFNSHFVPLTDGADQLYIRAVSGATFQRCQCQRQLQRSTSNTAIRLRQPPAGRRPARYSKPPSCSGSPRSGPTGGRTLPLSWLPGPKEPSGSQPAPRNRSSPICVPTRMWC